MKRRGSFRPIEIRGIFRKQEKLSPIKLCNSNYVRMENRLWALCNWDVLPDVQLRLLACHWKEQTLLVERARGNEPHETSWAAVEAAKAYAAGDISKHDMLEALNNSLETVDIWGWNAHDVCLPKASEAAESVARDTPWAMYSVAHREDKSRGYYAKSRTLAWELECFEKMIRWVGEQD